MGATQARRARLTLKTEVRRLGTYDDVIAAFRRADQNGDRALSMAELHRLMCSMNKKWTEMHTHNLFRVVDSDANGEINIDEFISFVFANEGGVQNETPYEAVMRSFRSADLNRNGVLDKREFHRLMSKLQPNEWDAEHTNQVFGMADRDGSGEVDSSELIGYIFGAQGHPSGDDRHSPQDAHQQSRRDARTSSHHHRTPRIVIQFTHGTDRKCLRDISLVEARWKATMGSSLVVSKVLDEDVSGITNVTALAPHRLLFWDQAAMMAHRENPFATDFRLYAWADEMAHMHFPVLAGQTSSSRSTSRTPSPSKRR